jgi:hypothetical protein
MAEFITIANYSPGDIHVVLLKKKLEEAGILCVLKNENAAYKEGGGTCELQIMDTDYEIAKTILVELGYYKKDQIQQQQQAASFFDKFNSATVKIPLLKTLSIEMRLLVSAILIFGIISTLLFFILQPGTTEILEKNTWCIDRLVYKGQEVPVNSTGIILVMTNRCKEIVTFSKDGHILLPGINSIPTKGDWLEYNNQLTISAVKDHAEIYEGDYQLEKTGTTTIMLRSATTTIYLHSNPW